MAFTNDPSLPRDRVRMSVGDVDPLNEYLTDSWYDYYLTENDGNETLAAIDAAKSILVRFTNNTREKVDQVEIWGNDQFDNYLAWLKNFIENPALSGLSSPVPFGGGTSKKDIAERRADSDNNLSPFYTGCIEDDDEYFIKDYWYIRGN